MRSATTRLLLVVCCAPVAACALVLDYQDYQNQPGVSGGAGQGGSPANGATSGSAGSGGESEPCDAGDVRACYRGPKATRDIGSCMAGTEVCLPSGEGYGDCEGQVLPSTEYCTSPQDEDCDGLVVECTGSPEWTATIVGPGTQRGLHVAAAPNGDLIVAGMFTGQADTGIRSLSSAGGTDIFVVRYASDGSPLWAERWGDAADQVVTGVAVDGDGNLILAGHFAGELDFGDTPLLSAGGLDVFVAELDPSGSPLWSHRAGDELDQVCAGVAVDARGNVHIAGAFQGSVDFGGGTMTSAGDLDLFVAGFEPSGQWVHSRRFGDAARQQATAIAVNEAGRVAVAGDFEGALDLAVDQFAADSMDGFVVVLDADGAPLWARDVPGLSDQRPTAVAIGSGGDVVVAVALEGVTALGEASAGATDVMVVGFSDGGASFWTQAWGNAAMQEPTAIALDGAGNVIISGWFQDTFDLGGTPLVPFAGTDGFIAKLDAVGEHVWSHRLGGIGTEEASAVIVLPNADVVACGWFDDTIELDGGLTSSGVEDAYVVKLKQ